MPEEIKPLTIEGIHTRLQLNSLLITSSSKYYFYKMIKSLLLS